MRRTGAIAAVTGRVARGPVVLIAGYLSLFEPGDHVGVLVLVDACVEEMHEPVERDEQQDQQRT